MYNPPGLLGRAAFAIGIEPAVACIGFDLYLWLVLGAFLPPITLYFLRVNVCHSRFLLPSRSPSTLPLRCHYQVSLIALSLENL